VRSSNLGRHVFGAASLASGLITLAWHNYKDWDQLHYILNATDGPAFVYAVGALLIFGGTAIQFRRAANAGAVAACVVYLVFALLCVPGIVAAPEIYDRWGNFFEQFSLLTGAALIYARSSSVWRPETLHRMGRISLGICAGSFALEQAVYLNATTSLVPKWLPPSQKFWAMATTVPFAVAAIALLTNRMAIPATRLLTIMILSFGVLVWIPLLVSHTRSHTNWSETSETFAIAGAVWILAGLLGEHRRSRGCSPFCEGRAKDPTFCEIPTCEAALTSRRWVSVKRLSSLNAGGETRERNLQDIVKSSQLGACTKQQV